MVKVEMVEKINLDMLMGNDKIETAQKKERKVSYGS